MSEEETTNDYQTGKEDAVPVDADEEVQDQVDEEQANSDAQLQQDEKEAISEDNIIDERTRGAKPEGGYSEPGEEDIPTETTS